MSLDKKIFDAIVSDLAAVVAPRVKKSLRMLVKERKEKEQKMSIVDDLKALRSHYVQQIGIMFDEIENESFIKGVMAYAEYREPKEEDE